MKAEVIDHFKRQITTLDSLFGRVTDEAWRGRDVRLKGVWQWMTHALETIEFYLSDTPPGDFPWGRKFGVDWEDDQAERVPSREQMKQYLDEVARHALALLESRSEDDFAAPETVHTWTGPTYLARMLYLLRHTQQHIGDMNRVLASCGCPSMQWQ